MADERITPEGYSKEEEYFYRKNKELMEQARKKLDADRAVTAQRAQDKPFWMVCPKCGAKLHEVELGGVKVDQCAGCGGLFFDKGEVELLTGQPSKGVGSILKGLFQK